MMQSSSNSFASSSVPKQPFGDVTNKMKRLGQQPQDTVVKASILAFRQSGLPASALAAYKEKVRVVQYSPIHHPQKTGANHGRTISAEEAELEETQSEAAFLRTCASVRDLEVASVHSTSHSQISATCFALKGSDGRAGDLPRSIQDGTLDAGGSESEASAAWTPRSCMARLHGTGAAARSTSAGVMSPRSCVTAAPGPMAGGRRRLPAWARCLAAVTNPKLQAMAQDWQQQQSLLASMHLHPHEEDQEAELSNIEDSLSAFADDMQAQEDLHPQGQQDTRTNALDSGIDQFARGEDDISILPPTPSGILSQALKAANQAGQKSDTLESLAKARWAAPSSMSSHVHSTSVAELVRIWQHQPMTVHSLPQQRSDSGAGKAGLQQGTGRAAGAPSRGYMSPLVLSKVQSYLDTAASPSGIQGRGAVGTQSVPCTARSMTAAEQAKRTQWWGKQGLLFREKQ